MDTEHEESILRSLRRITRAIDLHSRQLAKEYKLTAPQLVCLRYLFNNGKSMPSMLAREVALSQATVTGILDRLEARELVTRQRDTADKRRVIVALTGEAREVVVTAPLPLQQRFAARLRGLPEAEQHRIAGVLDEIVEMMEAEDLEASPVLSAGPIAAEPSDVADFLEGDPTATVLPGDKIGR